VIVIQGSALPFIGQYLELVNGLLEDLLMRLRGERLSMVSMDLMVDQSSLSKWESWVAGQLLLVENLVSDRSSRRIRSAEVDQSDWERWSLKWKCRP
jgi:hypothetical protein